MARVAATERSAKAQAVSRTVVSAVADITGSDPAELEPLYYTVDPDALNALFESGGADSDRPTLMVTFSYSGCEVEVAGDGTVTVSRSDREVTKRWEG